jgi:putative ABC transport system permease protein
MNVPILQDLRYAARAMRRSPGFTLLAVLTMTVGIGANASIFSVVEAVLLRPLPYPRADELVVVSQFNRQTQHDMGDATPANFLDWRVRNRSFAGLAAHRFQSLVVSSADRPDRIDGAMVTANFFDVLAVRPVLGRAFTPDDERPGAPRVAVVGDGFWRERLGGREDAIGRTLRINDEPTTIVGVMPAGVEYPDKASLWITPHWRVPDDPQLFPAADPSSERGHGYFLVVGRLRPGVTVDAARSDMDRVAASLEHDYPADNRNIGVHVTSLRSKLVADVKPMVTLLFAAVGLLLLIATANVSGLLVARASARQQEIAVRVALGASPWRIVAQLLTESVLLALVGGAGGVLFAMWLIGPLVALSPDSLTVAGDVRIDGPVLAFCLGVSVLAGIAFGLAPARQLTGLAIHEDLQQSARGATGPRQRRLRGSLVAAEIALSLVLLVCAGLTIRSFVRLQHVSTGFDADGVLTFSVSPQPSRYPTPARRADFYEQLVGALRSVPGVQRAGAVSRLPLQAGNSTRGLSIAGLPSTAAAEADYRTATPDYFATLGIPLLRGRTFTEADREGRPLVAVVSASLAERYWPGRDPIGERFSIDDFPITVVGIVGDVHSAALDQPVRPTVYVPYRQDAFPFMTVALRTASPPAVVAPAIRDAVQRLDRAQPFGELKTMDAQLSNSLSRRRFAVLLLAGFGAAAVSLAAIGLYGVLAFVVSQRRREIGVRLALGATPGDVVRQVLGEGLRLAAIGVGLGVALAAASTRILSTLLYGTSPTDALTFLLVSLLLVLIAAAASLVPALRASRVAPLVALRDT